MAKIQKFEDLDVYKNALDIAVYIYKLVSKGKLSKDYKLKDQLTSAALSISNNIAEGFEYDNKKDFIKFLRYSKGSTGEVRNMLNVLIRIEYINEKTYSFLYEKLTSLSKQLYGFIHYLKNFNSNN